MSKDVFTEKQKTKLKKFVKSSKDFTDNEKTKLIKSIEENSTTDEFIKVFNNTEYCNKIANTISKEAMSTFLKDYEKLIQTILKSVTLVPMHHSIALEYSKNYSRFLDLTGQNNEDKIKKLHRAYHCSNAQLYFILGLSYIYTLGIAYILRKMYINNKKKKFIQFVQSGQLDDIIDLVL